MSYAHRSDAQSQSPSPARRGDEQSEADDRAAASRASASYLRQQFGVQLKSAAIPTEQETFRRASAAHARRAFGGGDRQSDQSIADEGIRGPAVTMPFQEEIQASFGDHDVSGIEAHIGGPAAAASDALGAAGYATGDQVAFRDAPDLHTAAHEAAHVVQQTEGVQLEGGMGAESAAAERHADKVADRVVAGESAVDLLDSAPAAAGVHRQPAADTGTQATEVPRLTLDPPMISFGSRQVGQTYTKYIKVTNDGTEAVTIAKVSGGGAFSGLLVGPKLVEPGTSTHVMLVYEPTGAGDQVDLVTITTPNGTGVTVLARATAVDPVFGPVLGPQASAGDSMFPWAMDEVSADLPTSAGVLASSLVAHPGEVHFGEDVSGDVSTLVTLRNVSQGNVTIDDCYVVGGGSAFAAEVIDGIQLGADGVARVAIEYRPDLYAGSQATLMVFTSDGAVLQVPLSGPAITEYVSRPPGNLEVIPSEVTFDPQQAGSHGYSTVLLRNRGLTALRIRGLQPLASQDSPFRLQPGQKNFDLAPGQARRVGLTFSPPAVGSFSDTLYVNGDEDTPYGAFTIRGEAIDAPVKTDEAAKAPVDPAVCVPLDQETVTARTQALGALADWFQATGKATEQSHNQLVQEWIEYLTYTSLNPTISRSTVPDASVMRSVLSNGFGNYLADNVIDVQRRVTPAVAGIANKMLNPGGTPGLKAGKMALKIGGGAAFVVGVLVETLAGILFDALFPDDSAEKAMQEAYEQGQADGAVITGEAIKAKVGELSQAKAAADQESAAQEQRTRGTVAQSCSAEELVQITADLRQMASDAAAIRPQAGAVSQGLLALWVRDHATSTQSAPKGLQKQWEKATAKLAETDPDHFEAGRLKNQPDLFMAQCLHEWGERGLSAPAELQAAIYDEMGANGADLTDASQAAGLAKKLAARFSGREFVWDHGDVMWWKLEKGLGYGNRESGEGWAAVSCQPVLEVKDDSCVVKRFDYRIQRGVHDVHARSLPGDPKWHSIDDRSKSKLPPPHAQGQELFDYMAKLREHGYDIAQEADAAQNSQLQAMFGESTALAATQHADGRHEPITVYRLCADAAKRRELAGESWGALPSVAREFVGDIVMLRGGNTILVIEGCAPPAR